MTFTSEPSGATVLIDGDALGTTPLTYEMDRSTFRRKDVMLRMPGYRSERFPLKKTLNTTALFNCTSVLFWGTDALTGAMMEYSPGKYFIELSKNGNARAATHRWAMQFVMTRHEQITRAIARRNGEDLRVLAALFGVFPGEYPRFLSTLSNSASALIQHSHPHELFVALRNTLERAGWVPNEPRHLRFDFTFEIMEPPPSATLFPSAT